MSSIGELFVSNPELWRNFKIELRAKRVVIAGVITAVFALIVLPSLLPTNRFAPGMRNPEPMSIFVMVILWSQRIVLTLGGGISCWRSVRRERELNTYDYQRITRLSPLEFAIGKLFGAPALAYFVTFCLALPAVVVAGMTSTTALTDLLQNYVLLFAAALVVHTFALMISTVSDKGGASSGVILLLLLQIFPVIGWLAFMGARNTGRNLAVGGAIRFYGIEFPPTLLWSVLELCFAAWFLLAVVRNIKNDLEATQLFTVWQGLGFAAFCNFVWIGFYPWQNRLMSVGGPLLLAVVFFYLVGIGVLRSRELVRRGLREATAALSSGGRILGPIAAFAGCAVLTEAVILLLAERRPLGETGLPVHEIFLMCYLAAWVARDLFYLQWMKIRAVRGSLRKAFLYLGVFYVASSIVFRSSLVAMNSDAALAACLLPFPVLGNWSEARWNMAPGMWMFALAAQFGTAVIFAFLYRQEVLGLSAQAKPATVAHAG